MRYLYSDTRFIPVSDAVADSLILTFFDADTMSLAGINSILSSNSSRVYTEYSDAYDIAYEHDYPLWRDAVEKMVLDEEALEGMFEGQRFWDLMRWAMYKGDRDFIAREVAKRKGSNEHDSRADALLGGNWYLPLPKR